MRNVITKTSLLCLVLLVAFTNQAHSGPVEMVSSEDDLIIGARAIVIGRVLSLEARLDSGNDRIFTYIKIRVNETIKGEIRSRKIVLKEEGGEVDGQGSIIFGAPQFSVGEQVFLYLDTWPDGSLRVHQMSFGKLSIVSPPDGRQTVVRSEATCGGILEPTRHHAHSLAPISAGADLSEYKRIVQARFKALTSRSQAFQLDHYRDTPMLDDPPEYEQAKNKREIHPQFKLLFPIRSVRWFEPDINQPVVFYINPDGAPNPQVVEDVGAAMLAWSNVEGSNLRVVNGGPRNACSIERTLNVISFNNCDGRFAPSAECSRIIALGGLRWTSDATHQVNGQSYVQAAYGFISFNPYSACSFNNHCDLREVATHEIGHTLGLGHSQHPEATMFGAAHFDGRCASLTQDDVEGIAFVYPTIDSGSRPLAIETTSLPNAVKLVNHIQSLNATGGVLPHTWTLVDFLGRPPTGLSLSTGGILFGLPSDTGTFNFTVQVIDGEGSSVQRRFSMIVRDPIPYDSQFISQTVVPPVRAGQQFGVVLKWVNNGSEIWDGSIKPLAQNPANNTIWRATIAPVSGLTPKGMPREIRLTAIAPSIGGTYDFQWQLHQDGRGFFGEPSGNLRITVVPGPPAFDISSPPQGFVGTSYSYQLAVVGGTQPHVWSIASGSLPAGLVLNPVTGLISGIPTAIGTASFTAQVTDSVSRSAQRQYSITVAPGPALPLRLNVEASLQAVRGTPFEYRPEVTGGTPPYTWSIASGALPTGLTFNIGSGALSGIPSVSGDFNLIIAVRDQRDQSATGSIQIRITESVPTPVIRKVKYKVGKKKLIVIGDRFEPNAILTVDGIPVSAREDSGTLTAKPVTLAPGAHAIRVVNSSGVSSQVHTLTVE